MSFKGFGLEIRKVGDLGNLYRDVDAVLQAKGLKDATVNMTVQAQTAAHALNKMLQPDKYLDVCTIKECAKICSLTIPAERMDIYQAAHCIHWNAMLTDYKTTLFAMILDDFRSVLNPNG